MKQGQKLESVRKLSRAREREAAARLVEALRAKHQAEETLTELIAYRRQYEHALRQRYAQGQARPADLLNARRFLEQLNQAVAVQQQRVAEHIAAVDELIAAWRRAHVDQRLLDELLARHRDEQRRLAARREQREQDDSLAQRRHSVV
ncbi:MAG: hypothetical protein KatS3mg121_1435 [Gammaproteobacteria bacterium]|nr:MAG: hypothetical protein KatS3mg121_1435 [Gammaproteobacteria bacterium]